MPPKEEIEPWTIRACARRTRLKVVRAARREDLTVGQWLERRVDEELPDEESGLEADGSPVNGAPPDLGLVPRQQKQMRDEFADCRDQLTMLTSAVQALTVEVRVMNSRHDRLQRRVTELEGET